MLQLPAKKLVPFCTDLLVGAGVPPEDAAIVADVLVDASLEGIDTHGISRLPIYLSRLENGRINAKADIKTTQSSPGLAVMDGNNGLGQLIAVKAMQAAAELAKNTGMGLVTVKRSNHYGASSYFCKIASEQGMIGIAFTNTPSGIPPWGGRKSYFGTNPIAFAFPGKERPVVIDMSSSIVARGNIILAAKEGKAIPEGWAIDSEGRPTTDAKAALEGAVLPMAGPKGYALALAVEVMSGILSGSAYGPQVGWIYDDNIEPVDIGHCLIAIDISKLMPLDSFTARINHMVEQIKAVPKAEGVEEIFIPGERRCIKAQIRQQEGIPISEQLLDELNKLALSLGVSPLT